MHDRRGKRSQNDVKWFAAFGATMFSAAFAVTRGSDGWLFGFFVLYPTIALIYWASTWLMRVRSFGRLLTQLFWLELWSTIGMLTWSSLDEMATALYLFIPAAVLAMFFGAAVVAAIARIKAHGAEAVD